MGACGAGRVVALHLDYGLRPDSGEDAAACASLCRELGIELVVERPELPDGGNVQANAREARYAAAERLRAERGLDWIATGHTRTDLAETFIYRLATSPGRRALLGLPERRGALVRPLLGATPGRGARVGRAPPACPSATTRPTPSPSMPATGSARRCCPSCGEIGPAAEATIAETRAELAEEATVLERLADEALASTGAGRGGRDPLGASSSASTPPSRGSPCASWPSAPPGGRSRSGGPAPPRSAGSRPSPRAAWSSSAAAWWPTPSTGTCASRPAGGHARRPRPAPRGAGDLPLRGVGGAGRDRRRRRGRPPALTTARLDPGALGAELVVRAWRDGDRIRPVGLGGSKSLQDLFTDRKVPRSLRRTLPVVASGERIAWIAGVAVSEEFAAPEGASEAAVLTRDHSLKLRAEWPHDVRLRRRGGRRADRRGARGRGGPAAARERAGGEISRDYQGKKVLLVAILKGAVPFLADLMRRLEVPSELDFMAVSSYGSSTDSSGVVRILKDLDASIAGRDVLIVEDIIDSGLTLHYLLRTLKAREPNSLEVCALLTKPERRRVDLPIRYVGFEIPNRFAIGYGLDHKEAYRGLPYVAALRTTTERAATRLRHARKPLPPVNVCWYRH